MSPQFVELAQIRGVQAHLVCRDRRHRHRPALADLFLLEDERFLVTLFEPGLTHQDAESLDPLTDHFLFVSGCHVRGPARLVGNIALQFGRLRRSDDGSLGDGPPQSTFEF